MRSLLSLLILLAVPAAALAADRFRVVTLGGTGRITDEVRADLDGDGRPEILLLDGRRAVVHRAKDGDWAAATTWTLDLAEDALGFDVGQVDSVPGTVEIVLLTPEGVRYHAFRDGRPAPRSDLLIRAPNLATRGPRNGPVRMNLLRDLDGDGLPDLVLPTAGGFALYHQARGPDGVVPGRWPGKPDGVVPFALRASFSPGSPGLTGAVHGSLAVPAFRVLDFTGDGRPDFAVDDGRTLTVHPGGEDGRIDPAKSFVTDLAPLAGPDGTPPPVIVRDLTGDGIPELLVVRREAGVVDLHLGGTEPGEPARSFRLEGEARTPWIEDLDGDGRPDLVLAASPGVGPTAALRLVATGVITLDCQVYLNTGAGADPETGKPTCPYGEKPDLVRELQVKIRVHVDGAGRVLTTRKQLVELRGDFSGDGRRDLVHYQGGDRLAFYAGTRDGIYREDPWMRVGIPDTSEVVRLRSEVLDLDGDGRDDLLLSYRTRDRKSDRVVLLLTSGGKK